MCCLEHHEEEEEEEEEKKKKKKKQKKDCGNQTLSRVRFEVVTAVVMKSTIFWAITPCSPLRVNPTFRRNIPPLSLASKNNPRKKPA
jgi:hypothetical protein